MNVIDLASPDPAKNLPGEVIKFEFSSRPGGKLQMAISRSPLLLVAMGSSVYAGYLAALDESLYRTPSAGFEGRMAVLFALNGL